MANRTGGLVPFGGRSPLFRLFEEMLSSGGSGGSRWFPAVDIRETDNEIDLDVELPGIRPDDVQINVENGVLEISGEKRSERNEGKEGERYHSIERSYGSFFRSFVLPQGVDEGQIMADFDNGVLTVRIPKSALPQPRRIPIGEGAQSGAGTAEISRTSGRTGTTRGTSGGATGGERERMVAQPPRSEEKK